MIFVCVVVAICSASIGWCITYVTMSQSKKHKCVHRFEKILYIDAPGVHKAAYLCKDCGLVKKVYL